MTVIAIPDRLAVSVTADDIRHGKRSDNCECAIALALKRLDGVEDVYVEVIEARLTYRVDGEDYDCLYTLPQEAADFIGDFDHGLTVKPLAFTAGLAEWS